MAKTRKPRKKGGEETPEVVESKVVPEEGEEPTEEAPAEEAEEKAEGEEAPEEEPTPERRGLFPGTTRKGGFEMRPFKPEKLDLSPVKNLEEAVERVGGEDVVKASKVLSDKIVVIYTDNMLKAEFPIAAE